MAKKIRWAVIIILAVALLAGCIYVAPKATAVWNLYKSAKQKVADSDESVFKNSKTTLVYDDAGNELCKIKSEKDLYYLETENIPVSLKYAFIIMEDRDFYAHSGIDLKAIIRAAIANQQSDRIVQGASTITQQLSRNIFLSHEVTWQRKIEEMFIAWELEKMYDKEDILEYYLNNIYFGNGYYGVESAAKGYFSKSASELSISEQAFIAAIPNNPTKYNPLKKFDNVLARRDLILEQMYKENSISLVEYEMAKAEKIVLNPQQTVALNGSVVTYVRHCATESLMVEAGFSFRYNFASQEDYKGYDELYDIYYTRCQQQLLSGGYTVYTSIDMELQNALQNSVDTTLSYDTTLSKDGVYALQGAATCIDNNTGNVVAIVGSRSQEGANIYGLNRAYQSHRQPGSAIKPLSVFTPYLQLGNTPDTMVNDVKVPGGPDNDTKIYDGWITLRYAVKKSKNTMTWEIYKELTPKVGIGFLQQMGFKKVWVDTDNVAGSIGGLTHGVTTEEMAGGFATLANDGIYRRATCVVKIIDSMGNEVVNEGNRGVRVYDTNASRMMTDMLQTAMEPNGTGHVGAVDGVVMGAKSGSTDNQYDKWFCGYSTYYTTAVWMGYDYPQSITDMNAVSGIYKTFMAKAHNGKPTMSFPSYIGKIDGETVEKETVTAGQEEMESGEITAPEQESHEIPTYENHVDPDYNGGNHANGVTKPTGEWNAGNVSGGDSNAGNVSGGDWNAGNVSGGDWNAGNVSGGDSNAGNVSGEWDAG